jgi:hypothetical protein
VGEKQREVPVLHCDRRDGSIHGHVGHRVDVHVPQPGDEVPASCLHDLCVIGHGDRVDRADGVDAVACHDNCVSGMERSISHVDNGDAADRDFGRRRVWADKKEQAEEAHEVLRELTP